MRTSLLVNLWATGATSTTVGKAKQNANNHAFNQIPIILSTTPRLNIEITNDINPDIKSAIKKAKTRVLNFGWSIQNLKKEEVINWFTQLITLC